MNLLLDLGNTRLKWASRQDATWSSQSAVAWGDQALAQLDEQWSVLAAPMRVLGASVVDGVREQAIAALVFKRWGLAVQWVRTPAMACGVHSAYAEPERLGIDRFLAMVAAWNEHRAPCVLAGIGTALTLDALDAQGRHLGGLIAPGPRLMQQSVVVATVQVRPATSGRLTDAADNTADAVYAGSWHAAAALIERFVRRMSDRLGGSPLLTLGGGDAALLQPLLDYPSRLVIDGVLHGLAVWADAHAAAAAN